MNYIHPFRIQILGAAELAYLRGLSADDLDIATERLFTTELVAIVVANGEDVSPRLADKCNVHHIALFTSAQPSPHLVEVFRLFLSRVLAESTTLHGVFLDVLEMGVLVTGASAIGKSELALELISRGNGLIADASSSSTGFPPTRSRGAVLRCCGTSSRCAASASSISARSSAKRRCVHASC